MTLLDFYKTVVADNIISTGTIVNVQIFESWPMLDSVVFKEPCKLTFSKASVTFGYMQVKHIGVYDNRLYFSLAD